MPLYQCDGCGRTMCRAHSLVGQRQGGEVLSGGATHNFYSDATGCALCAPQAFARLQSARSPTGKRVKQRLTSLAQALASAALAYYGNTSKWPWWAVAAPAIFAVGFALKAMLPPKEDA